MISKTSFYIIALGLMLGMVTACSKPPIYDDVPTINFIKFSKDTITQFTGETSFVIGFTDGDGDLGSNDSGSNLFIMDNRNNDIIEYRIPEIPKQGVSAAISGEIEVDVANICCIPVDIPIPCLEIADTYQSTTFSIYIKDNAGNISNTTQTGPIILKCFQ